MTKYREVQGMMYCTAHDDVAIEGTDFAEECAAVYYGREPCADPCHLVELYVKKQTP